VKRTAAPRSGGKARWGSGEAKEKQMRNAGTLLIIALLFLCACGQSREERLAKKIEWSESYSEGLYLAGMTGRPIMLVFGANWCAPCQDLKKQVFTHKLVAQASKQLVNIYIDIDQDRSTAGIYRVRAIPSIFFLTPGGEIIGGLNGERSAKNMALQMNTISERYKRS
jgi:thioredoxin-related protein